MSSNKQILQSKMHKEIEAIKSKISAQMTKLGWRKYREKMNAEISSVLRNHGYTLVPTDRPGISVLKKI